MSNSSIAPFEWTDKQITKLISEYRKEEILWNQMHSMFNRNRNLKKEAWLSISNRMQIDIDTCKKKMAILSMQIRREKRRADNKNMVSRWKYYPHLKFLLEMPKPSNGIDLFQNNNEIIITSDEESQAQAESKQNAFLLQTLSTSETNDHRPAAFNSEDENNGYNTDHLMDQLNEQQEVMCNIDTNNYNRQTCPPTKKRKYPDNFNEFLNFLLKDRNNAARKEDHLASHYQKHIDSLQRQIDYLIKEIQSFKATMQLEREEWKEERNKLLDAIISKNLGSGI